MSENVKNPVKDDVAFYVDVKKRMPLVVVIMISLIGSTMFGYGLATAMMSIGESVNGLALVAWLFTASNIVQMVLNPLIPALDAKFGLPKLVLIGMILQVVVLGVFSFAANMPLMIAMRAVSGIAGGILFTGGLALAGQIVTPEKRATVTGLQMVFNGVGSMAGPLLAGLACDMGNWRIWTLIALVPSVVALIFYIVFYPKNTRSAETKAAKFDLPGVLIIAVLFVALALLLQMSGNYWSWISPVTFILVAVVVVSIIIFVKVEVSVEKKGNRPAFRVTLFKQRAFLVPAICALIVCIGTNGIATYSPAYAQTVLGLSATQSSLGYSIGSIFVIILSLLNGVVFGKKRWFKPCNTIGCGIGIIVAIVLISSGHMSAGLFTFLIAFYATFTAWISSVNFTVAQMLLPTDDVVDATAGVVSTQMIGAFLGVSLNTAIINSLGYSGLFGTVIVSFAAGILIMLCLKDTGKAK